MPSFFQTLYPTILVEGLASLLSPSMSKVFVSHYLYELLLDSLLLKSNNYLTNDWQ